MLANVVYKLPSRQSIGQKMEIKELKISGSWEITPKQFPDSRGTFLEAYKASELAKVVGHPLHLAQVNCSVSSSGVIRGIHFAQVPPSQAKYVFCPRGAVLDVVVDIRVGSPTFGQWDSVLLDDKDRRAIYISEGLGHAFMALDDNSTITYLCSAPYAPGREFGIHPLDPTVNVTWPTTNQKGSPITQILSEKDTAAPSLEEAKKLGILPSYQECLDFYDSLSSKFLGHNK